jgi:carboxypeptidase Taq
MASIDSLKERLKDVRALDSAIAIMEWDQQTFMPKGGAEARAEYVGLLSRMRHELFTQDETRTAVEKAGEGVDPNSEQGALVRVVGRDLDLATKIPTELVEEKSRLAAQAHEAWVEARANNDFPGFASILERMFEIARQEAEHLGYKDHIYDALLDQYEEGATSADVRKMFDDIKGPSRDLIQEIQQRGGKVDDSALHGDWDVDKQRQFTEEVIKRVGFDMQRGRQDTAPHPFCTGWSVGDIRLTTRFKPYLGAAIFGSLHEAGHGMYEQGSPMEWDLEMPMLGGGASLGLHESQSRLWENIMGRSKPFWKHFLPELQSLFPKLDAFNVDSFYQAINKVEPSFIRVEADELTYNMHIIVRFEIECDILTGALKVKDMPEAWNAKYEEYLGITPPDDSQGCLQDVHWSMGSIGYFPTYSMGNLLSYQIWAALQKDIPDTDDQIARGHFEQILEWLREKIYRHGRRYQPQDLVKRVTGKPMGAEDYLSGLSDKYREIYSL